mmetsp:Transcript_13804/g.28443  ORF Transcript_13804/g.28443 Transcript_13804/m.28443 type:complete len:226 (-) Transcript_13804:463-1140(-)
MQAAVLGAVGCRAHGGAGGMLWRREPVRPGLRRARRPRRGRAHLLRGRHAVVWTPGDGGLPRDACLKCTYATGQRHAASAPLVLGTASTRCSGKHAAPVRGNSDTKKHTRTQTTTRRGRDWESGERLFSCVLQRRDPRDKISDKSELGPERDPTSEAVAGGGAQDSGPAVKAGPLNAHLTPVAAELEGPGPQPARAAPGGAYLAAVDRESQLQEVRVREATRAGR